MIQYIGPIFLWAVIGWMLYYFIRKFKVFSPQTLGTTITAFLGGEIINLLHKSGGSTDIDLWYFLGVGIGFFMYAIYVGTLSILYAMRKIKNFQLFEVAAGCGLGDSEMLRRIEALRDFEDIISGWHSKIISDEELKIALQGIDYTKQDYYRNKRKNEIYIEKEILEKFENRKFIILLK